MSSKKSLHVSYKITTLCTFASKNDEKNVASENNLALDLVVIQGTRSLYYTPKELSIPHNKLP